MVDVTGDSRPAGLFLDDAHEDEWRSLPKRLISPLVRFLDDVHEVEWRDGWSMAMAMVKNLRRRRFSAHQRGKNRGNLAASYPISATGF